MKLSGTHIVFVVGLVLFGLTIWHGKNSIAEAQALRHTESLDLQPKAVVAVPLIPKINLEKLLEVRDLSEYESLDKRNIFTKFVPKTIKPIQPVKKVLKKPLAKPVVKPVEKEEVKPEKQVHYTYLGLVDVDGETAFIVSQDYPYKTHFFKKGQLKSGKLSLLEVGRDFVVIQETGGRTLRLTLTKEKDDASE